MALRVEYSLGHSEFNEFLFAYVGEEKSGLQLTVLSALARLGVDPWREAARLSELPTEAATRALAAVIAALPEGDWRASDSQSIAVRLVNSLPVPGARPAGSPQGKGIGDRRLTSWAPRWLVWLAFAAAVAFAMSRLFAEKAPEQALSNVWSNEPHLASVAPVGLIRPDLRGLSVRLRKQSAEG